MERCGAYVQKKDRRLGVPFCIGPLNEVADRTARTVSKEAKTTSGISAVRNLLMRWPEGQNLISTFPIRIGENDIYPGSYANAMQRKILVGIIAVLVVAASATGGYIFSTSYGAGRSSYSCPAIFATVSFQDASGFVAVVHPQSGTTEFVLAPNTSGHVTLSYSSADNILTDSMLGGGVAVWYVDTSDGLVQRTSNIEVVPVSTQGNGTHTMLVKYTISAATSEGLYLIGFPSTCRSALVNVGTGAYVGSLPW